jgi:predicted 3-demethylubiquinone-9 3-methyltransferase (glyoxalase superfamily)
MNKAVLFNEIESLPVELQKQVADFVAFLKLKNLRHKQAGDFEFSEEELAELDRRWEEYEAEPESAMEAGEFKNWVKAKYGV